MIDIHTHILPGLDDGAEDLEEALSMARLALADGVTALVATPHVIRGSFFPSRQEILETVSLLNERLAEQGLPLRVLPGAEYRLEPDLPERLAKGELVPLNDAGRYLLVELPSTFVPPYAERVLYELQLQGVTPILAHPERNAELCRRPELLASLAATFNVLVLFYLLARRIPGLGTRSVLFLAAGAILASLLAGGGAVLVDGYLAGVLAGGALSLALRLALDALAGIAVFAGTCRLLRLDEYLRLENLLRHTLNLIYSGRQFRSSE
ncbi:tyrosine-protein phosphatase [Ammonifex thiophilus]|uniref:protein-tyrosine-phosphatase n=1 Tax=Ammonifex thiophilus TaxID=444093 RepID=A0A3D8P652_9THEO|nr:CpsB/CapC family capsule biosynthesis tyrosine phosphatase [Ammonifex thiophilus]RDV84794.1 hypothetical protein DXX99_01760 [Ammonifex thiophilus]